MNPETSRLIAETLRLDAAATKGPWIASFDASTRSAHNYGVHDLNYDDIWNTPEHPDDVDGTDYATAEDAACIASYRTSAPRLARIAKMQAEYVEWAANPCHSTAPSWLAVALVGAERQALPLQHVARYVLAEIEKIARGE